MSWNDEQIKQHEQAARLLVAIKNNVLVLLKKNSTITEFDVQQYIAEQFENNNLVTDRDNAIVAFRENTGFVHYYPTVDDAKQLEPESLIMLDLWARLDEVDAPFADITWMAYYGKNPSARILEIFELVIKARDASLKLIRRNLKKGQMPNGKELDDAHAK
ncbi:MAG: M24 family metallopeptidase [Candidatus Falkowbacteria bacterium]